MKAKILIKYRDGGCDSFEEKIEGTFQSFIQKFTDSTGGGWSDFGQEVYIRNDSVERIYYTPAANIGGMIL